MWLWLGLQRPGAFRKGTTAQVPENIPTPSFTAKVDLDWPPMTGSLVTCHLRSVAEPSKVTSTTGDCACADGQQSVRRAGRRRERSARGERERERDSGVPP